MMCETSLVYFCFQNFCFIIHVIPKLTAMESKYFPADCAKRDPEVSEEMDKNFTDLLSEELKLREEEATEAHHHADATLLEAKKLASQYQKEADKCSSGMDTCEEARERAEAALLEQKRLTALWEVRARQWGWKLGNAKSR